MKLSDYGAVKAPSQIIFVGELEPTDILDSEGNPYYKGWLKDPIDVRCSSDKDIDVHPADFLLIREKDATGDDWTFVNGKNTKDGFFIKGHVADFSKGQEADLYQDTTIRKWTQEKNKAKGLEATSKINTSLRTKMADRKKKAEDAAKAAKAKAKADKAKGEADDKS